MRPPATVIKRDYLNRFCNVVRQSETGLIATCMVTKIYIVRNVDQSILALGVVLTKPPRFYINECKTAILVSRHISVCEWGSRDETLGLLADCPPTRSVPCRVITICIHICIGMNGLTWSVRAGVWENQTRYRNERSVLEDCPPETRMFYRAGLYWKLKLNYLRQHCMWIVTDYIFVSY